MSEGKKRKVHTAEFKAKVGLEAVRGVKTISEIAQAYRFRTAAKSPNTTPAVRPARAALPRTRP